MENQNNRNHNSVHNNSVRKKKKKKRVPNYPRIIAWSLPLVLIICAIVVVLRVFVWNLGKEYIMTPEDYEKIKLDTKDNIILMPASKMNPDGFDGVTDILVFGNDSFYAGRDDNSGILDYFGKELENVNIYDCTLPGTYLNSFNETELSPSECPEDYFTLFWLCLSTNWHNFDKQNEALVYLDPSTHDLERYQEVIDILQGVDFANIDVVMFCYDGHDYIEGHLPINYLGEDAQTENCATLLGSLYTSVYIINEADKLNNYAANTMLKFLEEPEDNIVAILLTDNRYHVLDTIISRCQILTLKDSEILEDIDDKDLILLKMILNPNEYYLNYNTALNEILLDKNIARTKLQVIEEYIIQYLNYKYNINKNFDNHLLDLFQNYNDDYLYKCISVIENELSKLDFNVNYKLWLDSLFSKLIIGG